MALYEQAVEVGGNAIGLFNLGWLLFNSKDKALRNPDRGEVCWRQAIAVAPLDGSEEAALHLYLRVNCDQGGKQGLEYLKLAADLGSPEAVEMMRQIDLPGASLEDGEP